MDNVRFDEVYNAVITNDTRFDGRIYVGITTTGIYCRPSCKSRNPKRENVKIYMSAYEAQRAGFRACKRCKPENPGSLGPDEDIVYRAQLLLEDPATASLTLALLAAELNVSPYHLHRLFKRITGGSPYRRGLRTRIEATFEPLKNTEAPIADIADIAAIAGFRSAAHYSTVFKQQIGITPSEYRKSNGAKAECL